MKNHTILVTGGGSGIGRGLAEAFYQRGNSVIIAGRRRDALKAVCDANPGMHAMELDISDAQSIEHFATDIVARFPALNMLINNAGMMAFEDLTSDSIASDAAEGMVVTNLLGPIRLTNALLPHLRGQPSARILNMTSGLAFIPMAAVPTYSATKAALHSYSISLRHQLRDTNISVTEIAPPYVRTSLTGDDPAGMPVGDYIAQTMALFDRDPNAPENIVDSIGFLRSAERNGRFDEAFAAVNARP
ncbi:oxidoreductase [Sphingomonas sp. Root710]|uniref:SDR family oxidoreductase n=1 Tax=Sphingomonas sp. Root710 TaxID=1736594 RepID=UPI0006FA010B|nr:SDR family NAD(P)-dependent oxidoreductase [Sphingomonas sp. Root710]KRB85366.1 oxidoreductase [Sphingomonas sp. Root710]